MASLSIRCGGSNLNLRRLNHVNLNLRRMNHVNPNLRRMNHVNPRDQNARFSSLNISNHSRKQQQRRISTAETIVIPAKSRLLNLQLSEKREENKKDSLGPEKMDRWIQESVCEIVQNLREAPLLVQVYSENNGETTKLKTEKKADVKSWPITNRKWNDGESPSPEGVILVEELKDNEEDDAFDSRAWGILIQGKGGELGSPVCYLLKTSRVRSSLGMCCTHFCLVRVKSFRETFASQLTNSWLLK